MLGPVLVPEKLILLVKSRLEIIKKDIHLGNKERT